jgi:hypothetical protein
LVFQQLFTFFKAIVLIEETFFLTKSASQAKTKCEKNPYRSYLPDKADLCLDASATQYFDHLLVWQVSLPLVYT